MHGPKAEIGHGGLDGEQEEGVHPPRKLSREKDSTRVAAEAQDLMEELLAMETDARRMETKRKGEGQKRAPKRSKYDTLVGWGEPAFRKT